MYGEKKNVTPIFIHLSVGMKINEDEVGIDWKK